jgi:hypothetical protein
MYNELKKMFKFLSKNQIVPIFIIFLSWFFIINVFALLALNRFNLNADTSYIWINPSEFHQEKSWDLISLHAHWDSFWYLDIAKNGYSFKGPEKLSNIVFFSFVSFSNSSILFSNCGKFRFSWLDFK